MNAQRRAYIAGTGSYAPERVITNKYFESFLDTTDEWISTRTGMKERRFARDDETTSDMGAAASRRAMEAAGVGPEDIDLIIAPTITPDLPWPNTACFVQEKIGAKNAWCVGLEAACSGFIYAAWMARNMIVAGAADTVLIAASEKLSTILDMQDRSSCVLFGDGAGAVVMKATTEPGTRGIWDGVMGSDGRLADLLQVPAGGSRLPTSEETLKQRLHYIKMNGRETYKHAVTQMTHSAKKLLEKCHLQFQDVQWFIPHQANMRIISAVGERIQVPVERFVINLERYGNTSSATIGIALDEAVRDGRIKRGDKILMVAFGGGLTWGSMLLEW